MDIVWPDRSLPTSADENAPQNQPANRACCSSLSSSCCKDESNNIEQGASTEVCLDQCCGELEEAVGQNKDRPSCCSDCKNEDNRSSFRNDLNEEENKENISCCSDCKIEEVENDDKSSCCNDCKSEKIRSSFRDDRNESKNKENTSCCSDCKVEEVENDDKSSCCSDCKDEDEEKIAPSTQPVKASSDNPDDTTCICCIRILVLGQESQEIGKVHIRQEIVRTINDNSQCLRTCCTIFDEYCDRSPCCFINPPVIASHSTSDPRTSTQLPAQPDVNNSEKPSHQDEGEKLHLEIRGMDCADCLPKVRLALTQLPSVTPLSVDYFAGIADLRYDPETIKPEAICNYVARATGFSVKVSDQDFKEQQVQTLTLPMAFPTSLPATLFEKYDAKFLPHSNVVEISFPIQGEGSRNPRDVFEHFEALGATLVATGVNRRVSLARRDFRTSLIRFIASAILTIPVLVFAWAKVRPRPTLYGAISLALTTIIQGIAYHIPSAGIRSIVFLHRIDMNVLVGTSTLVAYIYSVVVYAFEVAKKPVSAPFFETCALLITLILAGRALAAATRQSTVTSIENLQVLQPLTALLVGDTKTSLSSRAIDARLLSYGDVIRIDRGERIATDGVVIAGSSDVDESSVTGESESVPKWKGSRVIAGTLNSSGSLDVQVTSLIHENALSRIVNLVQESQSYHSPAQDLADKLSALVLPAALISACVTFLTWTLIGIYGRHQIARVACVNALLYAIAVIIVTCPCAIGLAIPTVIAAATRVAIREGLLVRSAETLQAAHRIDVVALDKTGTLTQGSFAVKRAEILVPGSEHIISDLVKDNQHPIARGISRYITERLKTLSQKPANLAVTEISSLPGKGIKGMISGFPLLGGSASFAGICSHPIATELQSSGLSLFAVSLGGYPIAFFGLVDTPRPGAASLVAELAQQGKQVLVLSGDTPAAVQQLATDLDIPVTSARASLSPEDKERTIMKLQAEGKRVLFIGDGTNDAPALSCADFAMTVESGSDVAFGAAGAVLLNQNIHRGVVILLNLATSTRTYSLLALGWCVVYNVFAILLASGSFVRVRIEPRWAGLGEVLSILPIFIIGLAFRADWKLRDRFRAFI